MSFSADYPCVDLCVRITYVREMGTGWELTGVGGWERCPSGGKQRGVGPGRLKIGNIVRAEAGGGRRGSITRLIFGSPKRYEKVQRDKAETKPNSWRGFRPHPSVSGLRPSGEAGLRHREKRAAARQ